jgi:hypothetical protein
VPREYDSLIAKLVVWGADREEARRRTLRALAEFDIRGLPTTLPAHLLLLASPEFVDGSYSTRTVESGVLQPMAGSAAEGGEGLSGAVLMVGDVPARLWNPAMAGSASAAVRGPSGPDRGRVVAPMHGTILKVLVAPGDTVAAGDPVAVLEAMKMETHIAAGSAGDGRRGPGPSRGGWSRRERWWPSLAETERTGATRRRTPRRSRSSPVRSSGSPRATTGCPWRRFATTSRRPASTTSSSTTTSRRSMRPRGD